MTFYLHEKFQSRWIYRDSNLIHKSSDFKNLFMWLKPEQWKMSIWKINDWRRLFSTFVSVGECLTLSRIWKLNHSCILLNIHWIGRCLHSIIFDTSCQQISTITTQSPHCFDVHFLAENISSFEYVPFSGKLSQHLDMHIKTV